MWPSGFWALQQALSRIQATTLFSANPSSQGRRLQTRNNRPVTGCWCRCTPAWRRAWDQIRSNTDQIRITYELHTNYMQIIYITFHTYELHTMYIWITFGLHSDYIQIAYMAYITWTYQLHPTYIQITRHFHTDYIQITYRLHTDYIQITYGSHSQHIQG